MTSNQYVHTLRHHTGHISILTITNLKICPDFHFVESNINQHKSDSKAQRHSI